MAANALCTLSGALPLCYISDVGAVRGADVAQRELDAGKNRAAAEGMSAFVDTFGGARGLRWGPKASQTPSEVMHKSAMRDILRLSQSYIYKLSTRKIIQKTDLAKCGSNRDMR